MKSKKSDVKKTKIVKTRKLMSGRLVEESPTDKICITTKCPEKWVHFDLQDGNIWVIKNDGHARQCTQEEAKEVKLALRNFFKEKS